MTDSQILKSLIDEYKLEVNNVKFWTPYWREGEPLSDTKYAQVGRGPFKGKSTPQQIKDYLEDKLPSMQDLSQPEDYRRFMREELHLGIECSGLIYYLLDSFLNKKLNKRLQDHLYKSRVELLKDFHRFGSPHKPDVTEEFLEALPEYVSLSSIQEFWGNLPVNLAGVKVLTSEMSNESFADVCSVKPGDQIAMTGHDGIEHTLLIVRAAENVITYVHSGGTHGKANYYGGVEYGQINISDLKKSIQEHEWLGNGKLILEAHYFDDKPLRRLKVLSG